MQNYWGISSIHLASKIEKQIVTPIVSFLDSLFSIHRKDFLQRDPREHLVDPNYGETQKSWHQDWQHPKANRETIKQYQSSDQQNVNKHQV